MAIDNAKLDQLIQKGLIDFGATFNAALIVVGDKLGLYKAMAGAGPMTSAELAERARIAERYAREWLAGQAAGGYIHHDSRAGGHTPSEGAGPFLACPHSPAVFARGF